MFPLPGILNCFLMDPKGVSKLPGIGWGLLPGIDMTQELSRVVEPNCLMPLEMREFSTVAYKLLRKTETARLLNTCSSKLRET